MLMPNVQRNREKTLRSPFEAVLAAVLRRHHGRAMAGDHVDHLFADMAQRGRFSAGRQLKGEDREKIVAAFEVTKSPMHAVPRPRRHGHLADIDAEVFHNGDALARNPFHVRIAHAGAADVMETDVIADAARGGRCRTLGGKRHSIHLASNATLPVGLWRAFVPPRWLLAFSTTPRKTRGRARKCRSTTFAMAMSFRRDPGRARRFIVTQARFWNYYTPDGPGPGFFPTWYGLLMIGLRWR